MFAKSVFFGHNENVQPALPRKQLSYLTKDLKPRDRLDRLRFDHPLSSHFTVTSFLLCPIILWASKLRSPTCHFRVSIHLLA